jgi:hypothetical protein
VEERAHGLEYRSRARCVDLNLTLDKSDGEAERRVAGVKAHVKGARLPSLHGYAGVARTEPGPSPAHWHRAVGSGRVGPGVRRAQ